MGALISFDNLDDAWLYRQSVFEIMLYHSVIRQSSPQKLPNLYPDVEREIAQHLHVVDPERYPDNKGSLGLIVFDKYPIEERREFLRAMKKGVEEIRTIESSEAHDWDLNNRDIYVQVGDELIEMMERSLALAEASGGSAAPSPAISGGSAH